MKIAILGPVYPFRGGIAHHTAELARNLEKQGHQVDIFSFRKIYPAILFPGKTQFETLDTLYKVPSTRTFTPWNHWTWKNTVKLIDQGNYDVLLVVWWSPFTSVGYAQVCSSLKSKSSPAIIFLLHNVIPHEAFPGKKFFSRRAFRYAEGFIVQADFVRSELLQFYPEAEKKWQRVVLHPIYETKNATLLPKKKARKHLGIKENKILLFFGLVRHYKGLKTLIEAFHLVQTHFKGDIRLIIAGEFYESTKPYLELIDNYGLSKSVTVHNRYIAQEEMGDYFRSADVVVLPYLSASQSGVIQTAFGYGKPVISTAVGGLPEVIKHQKTGLICLPDNPTDLAEKIIEFYALSPVIDWESNIEADKVRFSWNNFSIAIEEFFAQKR